MTCAGGNRRHALTHAFAQPGAAKTSIATRESQP